MTDVGQSAVGFVLDLDPDLGHGIEDHDWEAARQACRGMLLRLPAAIWDVPERAGERDDLLGMVIVDGLLFREMTLGDRFLFELLGPGDVVQLPVVAERPGLAGRIKFTAVVETTLAGLGEAFIRAAARWPGMLASVMRRLEAQRERLAIQALIGHLPRAEDRVLLHLWHLAEQWGRVTPQGRLLPLPLSHDLLGQLSGARRSTVTLAVSALEAEGRIRREADGTWMLRPAGEHRVKAIAGASRKTLILGQSLKVRQDVSEVRAQSRALRAEALQIRAQRRADAGRWSGGRIS